MRGRAALGLAVFTLRGWPALGHAEPTGDPQPDPRSKARDGTTDSALPPQPADPPTQQRVGAPEMQPLVPPPTQPVNPTTTPPPNPPTTPVNPPTPPPTFPQHFVFGNGLSLLITRLSVGYEFLPVVHHSIGFSIYGQYGGGIISGIAGIGGAFVGVGTELGYRFYAFRDGPFGPFLGLSFISGYYHTQATVYKIDPEAFRYAQYGPAIDVGWSLHLDRTTVLALGLGAQYTFTDVDPRRLNELTRLMVGDGPRPRAQVQVGKVF